MILYARFESDNTDRHIILVLDRPTEETEVLYLLWLSRMNEWKERMEGEGESNRTDDCARADDFRYSRTWHSRLCSPQYVARHDSCVARITRRSRPPPIDIFHFLLHLSLENGTFRKGLEWYSLYISPDSRIRRFSKCVKKKKKEWRPFRFISYAKNINSFSIFSNSIPFF